MVNILRNRLKRKTIKEIYKLYHNPWFLVKKKDNNYQLINLATRINIITIRDIIIPLSVDKYATDLAIS